MHEEIIQFFTALVLFIAISSAVALILKPFSQPVVIAEILTGLLLGPSVFGAIDPELRMTIFSKSVLDHLHVIAQLGVVFYMFIGGTELNLQFFIARRSNILSISLLSFTIPYVLGLGFSKPFFDNLYTGSAPFHLFSLFIGLLFAVTAFPVLLRLLTDLGMIKTEVGHIASASAAFLDVYAWIIFAFLTAASQSDFSFPTIKLAMMLTLMALVLVLLPLIRRLSAKHEISGFQSYAMVFIVLGVFVFAILASLIGLHPLFGSFVFGLLLPSESSLAIESRLRIESLCVTLFLPAFFILTGLRTQVGLLSSQEDWLWCLLALLVAVSAKVFSGYFGGRISQLSNIDSIRLGVLLNTRGLMELVLLNIGLEFGWINEKIFTIFVIVALVTTAMTPPILKYLEMVGGAVGVFREDNRVL